MRIPRLSTCGVFWLFLFLLFSHNPARAEVSLVVSGISAITGSNISQAEKIAYDDAFYKAYLETALKLVPASSAVDLAQKLKGFVASRGAQDIIQYQIVSRSQQDNILTLSLDLKINETPLKEWLQTQAFTTPLGLRPLILLAISTRGPGLSERYEWWSTTTPKGYSAFENQLALRLRAAGENVADVPKRINVLPAGPDRASAMAASQGATLVIAGTMIHKAVYPANLETHADISLIDVKTKQKVYIFAISLNGTADVRTMNELIITAFLDQLRSEIAKKVVVVSPVLKEKSLCIDGIRDYNTYQSIITSLSSIDSVTKIAISRIQGHSICHSILFKGNLQDILGNLKQKQLAEMNMVVDEDAASIRLINP
jgi:hypothetical protein